MGAVVGRHVNGTLWWSVACSCEDGVVIAFSRICEHGDSDMWYTDTAVYRTGISALLQRLA